MKTQNQRKSLLSIPVIRGKEYKILINDKTYNLVKKGKVWEVNYYNKHEDKNHNIDAFTTLNKCYEFLIHVNYLTDIINQHNDYINKAFILPEGFEG